MPVSIRHGKRAGDWPVAIVRAKAVVANMSVVDKVALATGIGWKNGPCVGNTPAVPSINYPGLCLQDSPTGVRFADLVSVFPAGINIAATFNRTMMRARGLAMGVEFKGKGVNVALGPDINIVRSPRAGRNWETFGADPYLSGEASFETVTGLQANGLQACVKHYINNEQETNRSSSSSNVDDRTTHEIYLHPFLKAVQAGVVAFMCSYNRVNGTYSCENEHVLNDLLKGELGFQGYVMTDWWASLDTFGTLAANKGLDMVMPGEASPSANHSYFGPALVNAVKTGQVPTSRLDDMATRILAAYYVQGQDGNDYPSVNFDSWTSSRGKHVDVQSDHKKLIRSIGAASTVLLKNAGSQLPLGDNVRSVAVVGSDAGPNPKGPNSCPGRGCDVGILAVGWGSGTANFPYLVDPLSAITAKANSINATVFSSLNDTDLGAAKNVSSGKDVAFVFITADSGEGYITVEGNPGDRNDLNAWHSGDELVKAVAGVNKNTVVVIHAVGAIIMEAWIDHPNVTGVIYAGLQGQEAGNSLVDILWGDINPSGRLPYTIAKSPSDHSADISNGYNVDYTEGLYIDYRWFDKSNIAPRFEFGYGLSYTSFSYSALAIVYLGGGLGNEPQAPTGPGSSLSSWLHDDWMTVTFELTNTGSVDGVEIPQLYIVPPPSANSPPKQLRNFDSVFLQKGESSLAKMYLSRYSFAVWKSIEHRWEVPRGKYGVWVGASSRDRRLYGEIDV
ncbi:glycoside hydrolase family 3 protein [Cantharellus anzutake]|uniref:glycoside hydrolase family 3 protein n=1 Tax=Cantharellus anzutake TaxID=1750568 RepID=UPI0019075BC1|nr:glycoside hydrolase family 3 protein [Cantharellus anzutake]KAF8328931.1 glycoside hydrolase family 3 protein [Cantharellus anzutake]